MDGAGWLSKRPRSVPEGGEIHRGADPEDGSDPAQRPPTIGHPDIGGDQEGRYADIEDERSGPPRDCRGSAMRTKEERAWSTELGVVRFNLEQPQVSSSSARTCRRRTTLRGP